MQLNQPIRQINGYILACVTLINIIFNSSITQRQEDTTFPNFFNELLQKNVIDAENAPTAGLSQTGFIKDA